ncbi:hypothetical protein N0V88_007713 [Collariella sp. IMI 366227]|nr:hypothetical protein N0V88_007713 [Collariella sp. IMI 366227]
MATVTERGGWPRPRQATSDYQALSGNKRVSFGTQQPFSTQKKLSIGKPMLGLSKETAAGRPSRSDPTYLHRYKCSGSSFASDSNDSQLPKPRHPSLTVSHPPSRIPKSRTFSVLSSLTQSFSRGTSSRNVSGSSISTAANNNNPQNTLPTGIPSPPQIQHPKRRSSNPRLPRPALPTLSPPHTFARSATSPPTPTNPFAITTAMPPQYWTGRFISLQDRFRNELLDPFHFARRMCEIPTRSHTQSVSEASAAAQNNPSTSVYAVGRERRQVKSGIPQSATSGAILQSTPYGAKEGAAEPPSYEESMRQVSVGFADVAGRGEGGYPGVRRASMRIVGPSVQRLRVGESAMFDAAVGLKYAHGDEEEGDSATAWAETTARSLGINAPTRTPTKDTTMAPSSTQDPANTYTETSNTATIHNRIQNDFHPPTLNLGINTTIPAFFDEDETALPRRVFLHLYHLCESETARASLRDFQIGYAVREGKRELLPDGVGSLAVGRMVLGMNPGRDQKQKQGRIHNNDEQSSHGSDQEKGVDRKGQEDGGGFHQHRKTDIPKNIDDHKAKEKGSFRHRVYHHRKESENDGIDRPRTWYGKLDAHAEQEKKSLRGRANGMPKAESGDWHAAALESANMMGSVGKRFGFF